MLYKVFRSMFDYLKKLRAQYLNFESIKNTLYRFSLSLLAAGASLILGLLSFGGMYALWPALIPAIISFVLSVAYEGEIYSQNIERAFDKIFTKNYFKHQLAREFLKNHFQDKDTSTHALSDFRTRYQKALETHDTKTLDALEKVFSEQISAETFDESSESDDAKVLYDWLHAKQPGGKPSLHKQYQERYLKRRAPLFNIQLFSIITSLFMGLGTTYLLVEVFTIVPVLSAIPFVFWPMIITPMAAVAGLAYGLLTYNAITNLMANDTILAWYRKLRNNLQRDPYSFKHIGMAVTATLLFAMALTLTICTAGTWWTIVQEVPPLFSWMRRIPTFVMGVINPIITGLSSVVFNFENSSETLTMIEQLTDEKNSDLSIKPFKEAISNALKYLREKENVLQWLNPFRMALVFVVLPMRYVLFIGHLFSIGVTADRIPGFSKYFSAFLGSLSEGFEDVHYFFKHTHPTDIDSLLNERLGESQGHEHNQDLPSWLIGKIALPFYFLSACWDSFFSTFNQPEHQVTRKQSWTKQTEPFVKAEACCHEHTHTHHSGCDHKHASPAGQPAFKTPKTPDGFCAPCKPAFTPYQHKKPTTEPKGPDSNPADQAHSGCPSAV